MNTSIITGRLPSRSETFVSTHAGGFARRGCDVAVLSQGQGLGIHLDEVDEIDALGLRRVRVRNLGGSQLPRVVRMLWIGLQHPWMFRWWRSRIPWTRRELFEAWNYARCLPSGRSALVHVHYGAKAGPMQAIGALPECAVITWHGYDANEKPRQRGGAMYHELFKAGHLHTVGSSFMRQRLVELGAREDSISVIPMGIDLDRFHPPRLPRSYSGGLRIISVGRLHEMKGHRFLIAAVGELQRQGLDLRLRIVGEGPERRALEQQIEELGLSKSVELVGALGSDEILCELHQADLFALTGVVADSGRVETQGVVFAEAQATGLPVIACDVGGVSESLIDGETGILCPPGDVAAITRAIRHFIEAPEDLKRYGDAGRRFVEERFSLTKMLDSFEALYRKVGELNQNAPSC